MIKFLQREKILLAQARELKELRQELAVLRAQNDSMRQGMRRCISCEYRLDSQNAAS
ncbi:MAG: hypothetical protein ABJ308_04050 [Halieaceae bacterium]